MGIKGLSQFLRKKAPLAFSGTGLKRQETPQKVAVDVPLFLHKFFYAVGRNHVGSCFQKLKHSMIQYNLQPIWIFDGTPLALKDNERKKRSENREKYKKVVIVNENDSFTVNETAKYVIPIETLQHENSEHDVIQDSQVLQDEIVNDQKSLITVQVNDHPTSEDYINLRQMLPANEIVFAKHEAEALCSYLVANGDAYAALSDDSDMLAYNCPRMILGASRDLRFARVISMAEILTELQMSSTQFRRMCVMCGNDFIENVKGKGPVYAYKTAKDTCSFNALEAEVENVFETFCFESNGVSIRSTDKNEIAEKWDSENHDADLENTDNSSDVETRANKRPRKVSELDVYSNDGSR